jgi:hypothetical protein
LPGFLPIPRHIAACLHRNVKKEISGAEETMACLLNFAQRNERFLHRFRNSGVELFSAAGAGNSPAKCLHTRAHFISAGKAGRVFSSARADFDFEKFAGRDIPDVKVHRFLPSEDFYVEFGKCERLAALDLDFTLKVEKLVAAGWNMTRKR